MFNDEAHKNAVLAWSERKRGDVMERRERETWETGPLMLHGGVECKDVLIKGVDRFTGGYVCNAKVEHAEQIVNDHNQHAALVQQRRSLIDALEEVRLTLGGLSNHLKHSEDTRAMDYVEYSVKRIGDALAAVAQGEGRE